PVPREHLAARAMTIDEEVEVARERVASEAVLHEPEEAVVALPEIRRLREREDAHRAVRREDHASSRRTATASATSRPSSRKPLGETIATAARGAAITSTGTRAADRAGVGRAVRAIHQRRIVSKARPSSSAI